MQRLHAHFMLAPNRRDSSLDYTRPANFAGKYSAGKSARRWPGITGKAPLHLYLHLSPASSTITREVPAGVAATGDSQPHSGVPSPNEARAAKFAGAVRSLNEQFLQWARSQWTAGKSGRFWSNGMLDYLRHSAIIRRDFADVPAAQGGARPDHTQLKQAPTLLARKGRQHIWYLVPLDCFPLSLHC